MILNYSNMKNRIKNNSIKNIHLSYIKHIHYNIVRRVSFLYIDTNLVHYICMSYSIVIKRHGDYYL